MTNQPTQGITAEQFRTGMTQLAAQREAKKQMKQQAADQAMLELARERIRSENAKQGI